MSRQGYGKLDRMGVGAVAVDFPMMGMDNGLHDGKTDAVSAGLAVSGGVLPVEPVKELVVVSGGDFIDRIPYRQAAASSAAFECNADFAGTGCIFHGVVDQKRKHLTNESFITAESKVGFNIALK